MPGAATTTFSAKHALASSDCQVPALARAPARPQLTASGFLNHPGITGLQPAPAAGMPLATAEARCVPGVGSDVVSDRELVVLGTASQAPTRSRNHNGYLLRWDGEGLLFDPGEGTQRQMIFAGVTVSQITRICITHFHGDHCLGLPGVLQRMSLDRVPHLVEACYPAQNQEVFTRLRHAALFRDVVNLRERPVTSSGTVIQAPVFRVEARPLSHGVPAVGYQLAEPDGRRMLPDKLAALGIIGPDVGRLQRQG